MYKIFPRYNTKNRKCILFSKACTTLYVLKLNNYNFKTFIILYWTKPKDDPEL